VTSHVITRLASTTLLVTVLAGLPAPAGAATSGYTPEQVCGSGFGIVTGGAQPVTDHTNSLRGHAYLLYNAHTGEHCAVTIKSSFVGTPTVTRATLLVQGNSIFGPAVYEDQGAFKYYAGPVKARAKGRCVTFKGMISSRRADAGASAYGIQAFGGWTTYGDCGMQGMRQRANPR
jgi:hypothetical protein